MQVNQNGISVTTVQQHADQAIAWFDRANDPDASDADSAAALLAHTTHLEALALCGASTAEDIKHKARALARTCVTGEHEIEGDCGLAVSLLRDLGGFAN